MTYGNLINRIMEYTPSPTPVIGMGVTICAYTDRYAGTVYAIDITNAHPIVCVQEDTATRTDGSGMSDSQTYSYSPNKDGRCFFFREDKKGIWREVYMNEKTKRLRIVSGGHKAIFGRRDKRHDFSF